jgi:hypothetical protein
VIRVMLSKQAGTGGGSPKWDGRSVVLNAPRVGEFIRLTDGVHLKVLAITHIADPFTSTMASTIAICEEV